MRTLHHDLSACTCPACDVLRLQRLDAMEERLRCWGERSAVTLRDLAEARGRAQERLMRATNQGGRAT